tara:strand:+ start:5418 stop:5987 length:570 start_codon:yes stop_codon:yes gene_type:complete
MESGICHDLKSERREISKGLSPALRFVPILFYLALVLCSTSLVWFEMGYSKSKTAREKWSSQSRQFQAKNVQVGTDRQKIEALNTQARTVAKWLEGAHSLQPLCVAISRSVGDEATVAEVAISRNGELPRQLKLNLKIDGVNSSVLEQVLNSWMALDFRAYSAQQQKEQDSVDYKATLVFQNSQVKTGS